MAVALADRYSGARFDRAGAPAMPAGRRDWQGALIACTPLICTTWLSKFSVPPLGTHGIGLEFPLTFLVLAFGFLTGRMQFALKRLVLFLTMLSALGLLQLVHGEVFSLTSMLLMAALGFAYVFYLREG